MLSTASSLTALEVIAADRLRAWAYNYTTELFSRERLSVIITPTAGFTAPILKSRYKSYGLSDTWLTMKVMRHVFFANFIGLPAHTVPVGFTRCPDTDAELLLPVGVQLIGKHWGEHTLLRLANALDHSGSGMLSMGKSSVLKGKKERFYNPLASAKAYTDKHNPVRQGF
jgi:Asp-tRNA(Asn)/Glu-tRNA(Gln) amidotransferase A subunit family amidase